MATESDGIEYDFNDGYLVAFGDMVRADFEAWRAERRKAILDEITRTSYEAGLYDDDDF